ncbi:uncharacterized protein LOC134719505 isoform X2 [Mytilus trossulus]|uniref:uncharacterized protein LOC134719505 isoform X2 n=1 Tax=Mytilus trossulus TaxID=6551 RepID=UPI003005B3F4
MDSSEEENQHGGSKKYIFENENNCGMDANEENDDDINKTSDWVSPNQKNSCCSCTKTSRWNCLIVFLAISLSSLLVSIGFVIYLMFQFQDLSLEFAVLRNNSLHNRFQIKQSEEEVERLFVGHEKHSEHIHNMDIMLKNYTEMFSENIGKLNVDVNDLSRLYENQVKIQRDIQKLIETNNRNTKMKIEKLDTKDIVVQKQIDEIIRTQNTFKQKLSDFLMADQFFLAKIAKENHRPPEVECTCPVRCLTHNSVDWL